MAEFLQQPSNTPPATYANGQPVYAAPNGNNPFDALFQNEQMPQIPGLSSILNPDGTLKSQYQLAAAPDIQFQAALPGEEAGLNAIQENMNPLQQLESYADTSNTALSPWAQAQTQAEQEQQALQAGGAGTQANAARASAEDNLASHGGLSTGAMERLGINSANNLVNTQQNIAGQGILARLGIQSQDDQNKLAALEQLPGQEVNALQPALQKQSLYDQAAQTEQTNQQNLALQNRNYTTGVQQSNIANALAGNQQTNQYNMGVYQTQAQAAAANNTANAVQNSGKK